MPQDTTKKRTPRTLPPPMPPMWNDPSFGSAPQQFGNKGTGWPGMRDILADVGDVMRMPDASVNTGRDPKKPVYERVTPFSPQHPQYAETMLGGMVGEPIKKVGAALKAAPKVAPKVAAGAEVPAMARSKGGRIKLGVDVFQAGKEMATNLYSKSADVVVPKELLQNASDAVKGNPEGKVIAHVKDAEDGRFFEIEDNGPGMTQGELETVFSNLHSSGKRMDEKASGGKGVAKASFLLNVAENETHSTVHIDRALKDRQELYDAISNPEKLRGMSLEDQAVFADPEEVNMIKAQLDNLRVLKSAGHDTVTYVFKSTPDQLLTEGIPPIEIKPNPPGTPTGVRVKTKMHEGITDMYYGRDFLQRALKNSSDLAKTEINFWQGGDRPYSTHRNYVDYDVSPTTDLYHDEVWDMANKDPELGALRSKYNGIMNQMNRADWGTPEHRKLQDEALKVQAELSGKIGVKRPDLVRWKTNNKQAKYGPDTQDFNTKEEADAYIQSKLAEVGHVPYKNTKVIDTPGAKVEISWDEANPDISTNTNVGVLNNGLYQFNNTLYAGMEPVEYLPKGARANIISKVPEGHPDYPFSTNREQLNEKVDNAIKEWYEKDILTGLKEQQRAATLKQYESLEPLFKNSNYVYFDSGGKFDPIEMDMIRNSKQAQKYFNVLGSMVEDAVKRVGREVQNTFGKKAAQRSIDKIGFLFADNKKEGGWGGRTIVHGLNLPAPGMTVEGGTAVRSSILINPFSQLDVGSPDKISAGLTHTVLHEVAHNYAGNHNESFTSALADVYTQFGNNNLARWGKRLNDVLIDKTTGELHSELYQLLQVYGESRKREVRVRDIITGKGVHQRGPSPLGEGQASLSRNVRQSFGSSRSPLSTFPARNPHERILELERKAHGMQVAYGHLPVDEIPPEIAAQYQDMVMEHEKLLQQLDQETPAEMSAPLPPPIE
jgi:hypothetical protein